MSKSDVEENKKVHIIPVGFDYDRLIAPISRGEMPADKVILIDREGNGEDKNESNLAREMIDKLEDDFRNFLDIPVEKKYLSSLHDFEKVYRDAYEIVGSILNEPDADDKEIWVNISSAPRPVGFAFSAVLESYIADHDSPLYRNSLNIYYISPEDYLITEMRDELEVAEDELTRALGRLKDLKDDINEKKNPDELGEELEDTVKLIEERRDSMRDMSEEIENFGTTKGAKSMEDSLYVELPTSPDPNLNESEEELLRILDRGGSADSVSELAERWAEGSDKDKEALRSKVQYNVVRLDKKGYVTRERVGRGHTTELSTMGRLWVETH
jgi:hypothetical protein